jgi:CheY-like chemotaxis protein
VARILVAEDNDISQEVVRAALQTAGFAVDIVEDGAEAISAVQASTTLAGLWNEVDLGALFS